MNVLNSRVCFFYRERDCDRNLFSLFVVTRTRQLFRFNVAKTITRAINFIIPKISLHVTHRWSNISKITANRYTNR